MAVGISPAATPFSSPRKDSMGSAIRVIVPYWDNQDVLELHLHSHRLFSPPGLEIVTVDTGGNYSKGNNQGAEGFDDGLLVFLNDDTVVTPGWLDRMLGAAEFVAAQSVRWGLVGMRCDYVSGPQALDSGLPLNQIVAFPRVVTCAAFIQASVFHQVGGFDERFAGQYSDDALCKRLAAAGYQNYVGGPKVCHFGHVASRAHGLDLAADLDAAAALFNDLYGGWDVVNA